MNKKAFYKNLVMFFFFFSERDGGAVHRLICWEYGRILK